VPPVNEQDAYFELHLTPKRLKDGTDGPTLIISNRHEFSETTIPIIDSTRNVGFGAQEPLDTSTRGSIFIRNEPHSFGFDRKFSDLLQEYTLLKTRAVFKYAAFKPGESPAVETFFTGEVANVFVRDILEIQLASSLYLSTVFTKTVTQEEFPDAPQRSLGRVLPVIIGPNREVPLVWTNENRRFPRGVWGTVYPGFQYTVQDEPADPVPVQEGNPPLIFPDRAGVYREVKRKSSDFDFWVTPGSAGVSILSPQETGPVLAGSQLQDGILSSVRVVATGRGSTTTIGDESVFIINVYEMIGPSEVGRLLSSGRRLKTDYTSSINGSGNFNVDIPLDRAVPMVEQDGYLVSVDQTTFDVSGSFPQGRDFVEIPRNEVTFGVKVSWAQNPGAGSNDWENYPLQSGTRLSPRISLYGVFWNTPYIDTALADHNGLGHQFLSMSQRSISGVADSSLADIQVNSFIVRQQVGLREQGTSITGQVGGQLVKPHHLANLFSRVWNGSAWVPQTSGISTTKFADTHDEYTSSGNYPRTIAGATKGISTAAQILEDVMRSSASRMTGFQNANGDYAVYAWGTHRPVVATITEDDCRLNSVVLLAADSVVNDARVFFDERLSTQRFDFILADGNLSNFSDSLRWSDVLSGAEINTSRTLFGILSLRESALSAIGDKDSARALINYYMREFNIPGAIINFSVPFLKWSEEFSQGKGVGLDILDVFYFSHPDMPSFYGTSYNPLTYRKGSGATTEENPEGAAKGHPRRRARAYRCQIENIRLNQTRQEGATFDIVARVLIQPRGVT
jgi:hypothetical protein